MARSSFRKELTAINGLAELEGIGTSEQVGAIAGLTTRTVGQIFRNNETYVRIVETFHPNGKGQGRGVAVFELTNEGWYLILRKRGKKHA